VSKEYGKAPHEYYFPGLMDGHLAFVIDREVRRIYNEWEDKVKKQQEKKRKLQKPGNRAFGRQM